MAPPTLVIVCLVITIVLFTTQHAVTLVAVLYHVLFINSIYFCFRLSSINFLNLRIDAVLGVNVLRQCYFLIAKPTYNELS